MRPRTIARSSTAAAFALVATLATTTARADEPLTLAASAFRQQTGQDLPKEAQGHVFRTWQAFDRKGLAQTADAAPKGALVFYDSSYGAHGRVAVSTGDGKVLLVGEKEPVAIDTVPGRLGWVEGPKKTETSPTGDASRPAADPGLAPPSVRTGSSQPLDATAAPASPAPSSQGQAPVSKPRQPVSQAQSPFAQPQQSFAPPQAAASQPQQGPFSQPQQGPFSQPQQPVSQAQAPTSSMPSVPPTTGGPAAPTGAPTAPPAPANDAHSGETFVAKGTGYYPANNSMEGGFKDRKGKPLSTLQDFLENRSPFVSVAMDSKAFPYGTKLRIRELEAKYGRQIDFRVVDTGGAFKGKGTTRIDICTANNKASHDATVNGTLHCEVIR